MGDVGDRRNAAHQHDRGMSAETSREFYPPHHNEPMTDLDLVLYLVQRLRAWSPGPGDNAVIESAEAVVDVEGQIGLGLRWTQTTTDQGVRTFGLTIAIEDLLHHRSIPGSADPEEALRDLLLAVVEPHAAFQPNDPRVRSLFPGI